LDRQPAIWWQTVELVGPYLIDNLAEEGVKVPVRRVAGRNNVQVSSEQVGVSYAPDLTSAQSTVDSL
jgi:hypothetical protein